MLRLLAWVAMASAAIVVLALLVLHTNPFQSHVLSWAHAQLEQRFDLHLLADDLDFNLFTRRVTVTNARLAAVGHDDAPFFTAKTVRVRLPWGVFRGRLSFDHVTIDGGAVTIVRDTSGVSNLPPGGGARDPNAPARRIDIRGLSVRALDFVFHDRRRDIEIRVPGIRTELTWSDPGGARGELAVDNELLVRLQDRRVTMKPIAGMMVFDGSTVDLDGIGLDTSEGRFTLTGQISRTLDEPTLNLSVKGTTDLAVASRWSEPPVHLSGGAVVDARMTGAPSAFVLDTHVTAASAQIGAERDVAIDAQSRLTPERVTVSQGTIRPSTGGEVIATIDVPFAADAPWWIKANYSGIDAATAFRLGEVRPLPFGAGLSGTAVIDRAAGQPFRLEVHNTSAPRSGRGTAPLEGSVVFVIDGDRWRADQAHRVGSTAVEGGLGGIWNRQAAAQSTFEGTLDVGIEDISEGAQHASLFGLAMPDIIRDARGPMSAAVTMTGVFAEPRVFGSVRSDGLEIPALGHTAVSADFDASGRGLSATNIDATVGSTTVRGDVTADLSTRRLEGELRVQSPDVAELLQALPETLRLQGPVGATAILGGTLDAPEVKTEASGQGLMLSGQPIESLVAKAHVVDGGITIESVNLRQPGGGELRATGRYEWGPRTFKVDLDGQRLEWRGALAGLGDAHARMAVKFSGGGSLDRPVGDGAMEFTVTGGVAGELIDRGVVNVRLDGDTARITGHIPTLGALITANVTPRHPFDYDAVAVMNRIDLAPLVTLAGLQQELVTGTASLSANARGALTDITRSSLFINLQDLTADVSGVPLHLSTPSRLAWDGAAMTVDSLDVSVGQGRLLASGRFGKGGVTAARWESTLEGELGDLVKIGRVFGVPSEVEGAGPVTVASRSTEGSDQWTASLHLAQGNLGWGTLPAISDLAVDATFDGQTLNVPKLTGRWQGGGIEGTASIPREVFEARPSPGVGPVPAQAGFARLRVSGLTESALTPWLSSATLSGVTGRLSATLDARITQASLEGLAGTLVLDEADFTLAGVSVRQTRPSIVEIDGGVVTARDVAFDAGGSPLTLTGTARVAPADTQVLNLAIRGAADLHILSAFAPAIATDGQATVDIGIGGTFSAPVFSGRVDVAGAEIAIREPRVVVSELAGTIAMDGQRVVLDAFSGTANGGRFTLDGGFLLEGLRPVKGGVAAVIERAALEYPQGLLSEVSGLLTIQPDAESWNLSGEINVERSAYTEPISIMGLIASRGLSPPAAIRGESGIDRLRLNLWVTTVQDLMVDNNYGRFEVGGALRVVGTAGRPVLSGRLTLADGGEIYLAGNTFYISRGNISFTNPFRIEPEFDIQLRTVVSGTDLTLTIDGSIDRLRTDVRSSDPRVDSREAVALLVGGEGEDAVALLSAELLGVTGRAIGLDSLRLEREYNLDEFRADPGLVATETDPSARLTLSKRLRPDVEVILSQSLRESGGLTTVVSYKPRRNIELRAVSRDNTDRSASLRHDITFGADTGADGAPAPGPRITEVTISGDPQRPASELVALLGLAQGDRFQFHRWQRDMDRLRAAYYDQNHFEVRVRGTRRLSDDGLTVALEYAVTPGPVTELVVEGHPLERGLEDDLRGAWRRTIFDRFLLEEFRARIMRHLVSENLIGSTVDAVVAVSTPERKVIRVSVIAGTAVDSRVIRFTGNAGYAAARLEAVVASAGLGVDGWLDAPRVADALQSFYRGEGYLAATVTAEQPTVIDRTGVLPVAINEGPRFIVGAMTFPGVAPERSRNVASAAQMDSGTPFITQEVDRARQRIEEFYASEGFNEIQIEVDARPDIDRSVVAVSFAIREGLQQILREVTTQGATRTEEGLVRRALRLRVGTPVNLGDWSQARKRLYDTNVFRQVDIEPVPMVPTIEESAAGIQPVRAVIRVAEYPVWRLRYGTEFVDEISELVGPDGENIRQQSFGVLADLQNQNMFGRALTGGIAGRYEQNRRAASLYTSSALFFGLPIRSSGFIFASREHLIPDEFEEFIDDRTGFTAEQRWRPSRTSEVIWSYRFERSHTFDPDPAGAVIPLDVTVTSSSLNAAAFVDRRDDPTIPTRGWFTAGNWEQPVPQLGSDSSTGKFLVQQSFYRGVKGVTLAGRAQYGTSYAGELLFSERFTLGGATTVRGYAEDALGPRDILGVAVGGDALLNFNAEVRFVLKGWVQGVGFIDAGNVFQTRSDLSFKDLTMGYGMGLRLATPFAMLRFDFGVPGTTLSPDRPANQLKSGRWYFGIGHIF